MHAVGLHCVFGEPLDAARIERLANLFVDPRWPWPPRLLRLGRVPGVRSERPTKQGRVTRDAIHAALAAPDVAEVGAICAATERDNHAWLYVATGRLRTSESSAYPFELRAFCRAEWLPDSAPSLTPWLTLLDDLVTSVHAVHAVVIADDEEIVHDEVSLLVTSRNGKRINPRYAEVDRISGSGAARDGLGELYIRHPRWGTYLRREHVDALGGRPRIDDAVRPAELRDVGDLLYVQTTASAETATSAESLDKQRAFADLASAIVVPSRFA